MVAFFISSILCLYKHFTIYNVMCSHLCLFTSFAFIHFVSSFYELHSTTNTRNFVMQFLFSVIVSHKNYTYLFTSWCRVLLEKLTGSQLVKKFPTFYGT